MDQKFMFDVHICTVHVYMGKFLNLEMTQFEVSSTKSSLTNVYIYIHFIKTAQLGSSKTFHF